MTTKDTYDQLSSSCRAAKIAPRLRSVSVREAFWSAAACCRFDPASLLALHGSEYRAPAHCQQAGPAVREKRQQAAALQSTSLPWRRVLCYTAVVVTFLGAAGLLGAIPTAPPAASKGVFVVPPVRLTTMVKAAG
jgi:hypothetical protein